MNAYKEAWLAQQMISYAQKRSISKSYQKASNKNSSKARKQHMVDVAARQKAQGLILKGSHTVLKHAAQSQVKGSMGIALRVGGRVGLRLVPVVGIALLAYDTYKAVDWLMDQ